MIVAPHSTIIISSSATLHPHCSPPPSPADSHPYHSKDGAHCHLALDGVDPVCHPPSTRLSLVAHRGQARLTFGIDFQCRDERMRDSHDWRYCRALCVRPRDLCRQHQRPVAGSRARACSEYGYGYNRLCSTGPSPYPDHAVCSFIIGNSSGPDPVGDSSERPPGQFKVLTARRPSWSFA